MGFLQLPAIGTFSWTSRPQLQFQPAMEARVGKGPKALASTFSHGRDSEGNFPSSLSRAFNLYGTVVLALYLPRSSGLAMEFLHRRIT